MYNSNLWSRHDRARIRAQYGIFLSRENIEEVEEMIKNYLLNLQKKEKTRWANARLSLRHIQSSTIGSYNLSKSRGNPKLKNDYTAFLTARSKLPESEKEILDEWVEKNGGIRELLLMT